jgi:hypothetical protein
MQTESRAKTFFHVLCLAAFISVGAACFGLFTSDSPKPAASSCEGLSGSAKTDCESRQER